MSVKYFLDTNIFIYSFDRTLPKKFKLARTLIRQAIDQRNGVISFQVVHEFANVATCKFAVPLTTEEVRDYYLKILKPLCIIQSSPELFLNTLSIRNESGYSLYDSLIIASAARAGCSVLYSEGMQHEREINGVTIVNPFI